MAKRVENDCLKKVEIKGGMSGTESCFFLLLFWLTVPFDHVHVLSWREYRQLKKTCSVVLFSLVGSQTRHCTRSNFWLLVWHAIGELGLEKIFCHKVANSHGCPLPLVPDVLWQCPRGTQVAWRVLFAKFHLLTPPHSQPITWESPSKTHALCSDMHIHWCWGPRAAGETRHLTLNQGTASRCSGVLPTSAF